MIKCSMVCYAKAIYYISGLYEFPIPVYEVDLSHSGASRVYSQGPVFCTDPK